MTMRGYQKTYKASYKQQETNQQNNNKHETNTCNEFRLESHSQRSNSICRAEKSKRQLNSMPANSYANATLNWMELLLCAVLVVLCKLSAQIRWSCLSSVLVFRHALRLKVSPLDLRLETADSCSHSRARQWKWKKAYVGSMCTDMLFRNMISELMNVERRDSLLCFC